MNDSKKTIVVALGGNALQKQGEASSVAQQRVADETVRQLLLSPASSPSDWAT